MCAWRIRDLLMFRCFFTEHGPVRNESDWETRTIAHYLSFRNILQYLDSDAVRSYFFTQGTNYFSNSFLPLFGLYTLECTTFFIKYLTAFLFHYAAMWRGEKLCVIILHFPSHSGRANGTSTVEYFFG